jgi:hypothetical protein
MTFSNDDFTTMKNLMKESMKEVLEDEQVVTKSDISHLPTKEEFYDQTDKLMKEVKDSREEHTILQHQVSDQEDRITKLEERLQD